MQPPTMTVPPIACGVASVPVPVLFIVPVPFIAEVGFEVFFFWIVSICLDLFFLIRQRSYLHILLRYHTTGVRLVSTTSLGMSSLSLFSGRRGTCPVCSLPVWYLA